MTRLAARLPLLATLAFGCGGPPPPETAADPAPTTAAPSEAPASANEPPSSVPEGLEGEPTLATRDNSDWVVVTGFDLAFLLPPGWHRISAAELADNRQRMLRGDSAALVARDEPDWERSFQVGATEQPLGSSNAPIATVQVQLRTLPQDVPAEALCQMTHAQLAQAMEDAELIANEAAPMGPVAGHRCVIRYVLDTANGRFPIEAAAYFAMRGPLNLQITLAGSPPLDEAPLAAVLGSIREL